MGERHKLCPRVYTIVSVLSTHIRIIVYLGMLKTTEDLVHLSNVTMTNLFRVV